jgi:parallel beta-helix repeat protein
LANGAEIAVRANPWLVRITNNMIVNNVAAWAGAGISLQDTIRSQVINNTVTNNDSTATVGGLIVANVSDPQPAGIVAERHSPGLAAAVGDPNGFSSPLSFQNNIVWHNRAFSYGTLASATPGLLPELAPTTVGGCAAGADYWDLGVLGEPRPTPTLMLDPRWSILTDTTGYHGSNLSGDPDFLSEYCNGARTLSTPGPMLATAAFGEGGNFVDVRFGPLTQEWPAGSGAWDYHIGAASSGLDNGNVAGGTNPPFNHDFDNDPRPIGTGTPSGKDRGADEFVPPPALSSIAPASSTTAQRGSSIPVTLTGTGLNGATAVSMSGSGVAVVSFTVDSDTQITATFEISSGGGNRGAKDVSVTTSGGTSNTVTFTKN